MKNRFPLTKMIVIALFAFTFSFFTFNSFAQSGQKWATGGNSVSGSDFLGSTNAAALIFKTTNNERFKIDANGNIIVKSFIGSYSGVIYSTATGVLSKLDFSGSQSQYLSGDGTFRDIFGYTGWKILGNDIANSNSGNVGIGTFTPQFKLDVIGDARARDPLCKIYCYESDKDIRNDANDALFHHIEWFQYEGGCATIIKGCRK